MLSYLTDVQHNFVEFIVKKPPKYNTCESGEYIVLTYM